MFVRIAHEHARTLGAAHADVDVVEQQTVKVPLMVSMSTSAAWPAALALNRISASPIK